MYLILALVSVLFLHVVVLRHRLHKLPGGRPVLGAPNPYVRAVLVILVYLLRGDLCVETDRNLMCVRVVSVIVVLSEDKGVCGV